MLGNLAEEGSEVIAMGISSMSATWLQIMMCSQQRDRHPTLLLPPGLQALFFNFAMLWTLSGPKIRVDLGKVSFFYKSEKMSGQTVQPKQ